jgi:gas vesicle protein
MNKGRVFMGILAGVAVGTVLGLLFAPHKGTKTRKKIAAKGLDLAADVDGLIGDLKVKIEQSKGDLQQLLDKLRQETPRE